MLFLFVSNVLENSQNETKEGELNINRDKDLWGPINPFKMIDDEKDSLNRQNKDFIPLRETQL